MVSLRLALAALATTVLVPGAAAAQPVVRTSLGPVQGKSLEGGVTAFLGVAYGADTGGPNRFLPPKPAATWTETRIADRMGARCPQPPLPTGGLITFSNDPISEDCLKLNVWTSSTKGKRPVMVWLHGGGFGFGSANDKYYDGQGLARRGDVVVVSINHRLNVFGYLELGAEAGPAYKGSSLTGQEDIILALKWVRANAARFGGDPNNVTVFGQSGGGGKISSLLAMPGAKGLFHKAIIESGSDPQQGDPKDALAVRDRVLAALKLAPAEAGKLRDIPMADLVAASARVGILSYRPALDPVRMPANPFTTPLSADVPVLLGYTRDEATGVLVANPGWPKMTDADVDRQAAMVLGGADKAAPLLAAYRARRPQEAPMYLWSYVLTDQMFTAKAAAMADRKAGQGRAPVYVYRMDWRSPVRDGALRAPHGVEIPFVFDTVAVSPELVGSGGSQAQMTDLFIRTFSAFARTGNPNVKGYPAWPAYTTAKREVFVYDTQPKVVSDPDADLRTLWPAAR